MSRVTYTSNNYEEHRSKMEFTRNIIQLIWRIVRNKQNHSHYIEPSFFMSKIS